MSKEKITLGSLFDGIGGFPYAASFYGITPLWASEILTAAVNVTQRHFPDMEHVGDITRLDGRKLPPVDVLTFGSPCQGLSMAGRRLDAPQFVNCRVKLGNECPYSRPRIAFVS